MALVTYGSNGKISKAVVGGSTRYYTYNSLNQLTEYNGNTYTYDEMGNRATKRVGSSTIRYKYVRGNLLSEMSGFLYNYNCNGVRYQKYANGVTTTYYLDGEKILGEDRSDGTKLRYFYDIDGISGIICNGNKYECVRNAYGDVILIVQGGHMKACYHYDACGNCMVEQYNDANDIGNINPFIISPFTIILAALHIMAMGSRKEGLRRRELGTAASVLFAAAFLALLFQLLTPFHQDNAPFYITAFMAYGADAAGTVASAIRKRLGR